jgi:transcriptional regulator with XRE-family HTH domain
MDHRKEARDFLITRRERLTPGQVGLPFFGGRRRVKGLRREEVAMLAGMSTDYYTKLERGDLASASEAVLESLVRALQLDEAERAHLFDLAHTASSRSATSRAPGGRARRTGRGPVRPGVQRILDAFNTPAYVRNGRFDIVAVNALGRALFADAYGDGTAPFNLARYLFLDPRSQDFYTSWEAIARDCVAALRGEAGRNPYDKGLTQLIGELCTRSDEFSSWWAAHDVKLHRTATKTMLHPVVGELELTGEALELPGDQGLTIITYTVEPSSPAEEALRFLASWSASHTASPQQQDEEQRNRP